VARITNINNKNIKSDYESKKTERIIDPIQVLN